MKKNALHVLPAFCFQLSIRLVFLRARVAQKRSKLTVQIHAQFLLAIEAEFVLRRRRGGRRRGRRRREHGLVYRLEDEQVSRSDFSSSSSSPSSSIGFPHRRYRRFTHHTRVGHFLFLSRFSMMRQKRRGAPPGYRVIVDRERWRVSRERVRSKKCSAPKGVLKKKSVEKRSLSFGLKP